jgi:hypothetical protein
MLSTKNKFKKLLPLFFIFLFLLLITVTCKKNTTFKFKPWQVGQWVEYELDTPEKAGIMHFKYSLVGQEKIEGKNYFWYESRIINYTMGDTTFSKLLTPERFEGVPIRFLTKADAGSPIEEDIATASDIKNLRPFPFTEDDIEEGRQKSEKVTVKAGTFFCIQSKIKTKGERFGLEYGNVDWDVWVNSKVPICGVVKASFIYPEPFRIKIIGYSENGALTEITGEPIKKQWIALPLDDKSFEAYISRKELEIIRFTNHVNLVKNKNTKLEPEVQVMIDELETKLIEFGTVITELRKKTGSSERAAAIKKTDEIKDNIRQLIRNLGN